MWWVIEGGGGREESGVSRVLREGMWGKMLFVGILHGRNVYYTKESWSFCYYYDFFC